MEAQAALAAKEPITFHDVIFILRPLGPAPGHRLADLLRLHDAPHITDGGRRILSDYLGAVAARHQRQRALADATITLDSAGHVARCQRGQTLTLSLQCKRAQGFRWQIDKRTPHIEIRPLPRTEADAFTVIPRRVGEHRLRLVEAGPQGAVGRTFDLSVIAEG